VIHFEVFRFLCVVQTLGVITSLNVHFLVVFIEDYLEIVICRRRWLYSGCHCEVVSREFGFLEGGYRFHLSFKSNCFILNNKQKTMTEGI
jgi:hypothetical protein